MGVPLRPWLCSRSLCLTRGMGLAGGACGGGLQDRCLGGLGTPAWAIVLQSHMPLTPLCSAHSGSIYSYTSSDTTSQKTQGSMGTPRMRSKLASRRRC